MTQTISNRTRAIIMVILMCFALQIMAAGAKYLKDSLNPFEIIFYRGSLCVMTMILWMAIRNRFDLLKTHRPWGHLGRAFLGTASVLLAFWAYQLMPMAQALSLMLTAGVMITALSAIVLKENVGIWRWSAVILGFVGALIVSQPNADHFNAVGTAIALVSAFFYALVTLFLRTLGRTENTFTTVFYFVLFGAVSSGFYMIWAGKPLHLDSIGPILTITAATLVTQFLKTEALSLAESSVLAPFEYTTLIWGFLFGYILWQDVPGIAVWAGSLLIVAANLLIIWREAHLRHRAAYTTDQHHDVLSSPHPADPIDLPVHRNTGSGG